MDSIQSMASCSSSTVPSSEQASPFISQTEIEMESSKARHWSELGYPTTDSESTAATNLSYFALLKEDPQWGRFFTDFDTLEVGAKISGGAQADIYEARNTPAGPFNLVVKVMKGDAPLKAFQAQWPIGMLSARSKHKHLYDLPLITILGGTMLRDERLRGRFAFVMYRRWGDLRLLIDRRMKQERNTGGPFPIDEAIHLMLSIAEHMEMLHNKHDIIHRDLKASNVLVWGEFGEDISLAPNRVARIGSVVADFECSVGVLGTRFWRAPEILEQLKARVPRSEVQFTRASDVYSYGMTCFEIVTGCIPDDGLEGEDMISQILKGRRPTLPHDLPEFVKSIIVGCWHSDPSERLTFSDIFMALKLKRGPNPVSVAMDNTSEGGASIVKVEQWTNPQPLTLFEVLQKLMDMDLSVLKASNSSSTTMITQYFEVTDRKGKKVVNDESIANITKVLTLPVKMKWINETGGISINENPSLQMHVIEVIAKQSTILLKNLFLLLVTINFQVHLARCWTHEGRVEFVIFVEGPRTDTLLWELGCELGPSSRSPVRFKIVVDKVAGEEISNLSRRLQNLKSMNLTLPRSSSSIRIICQQKKPENFAPSTRIVVGVVCFSKSEPLVHVSRTLVDMDYIFSEARIQYPGFFYKSLKNMKRKVIKFGPNGSEVMENMKKILDVTIERRCSEGNRQLIILGSCEEVPNDLMRSLCENGLSVTGGQVHLVSNMYNPSIEFFVTENLIPRTS